MALGLTLIFSILGIVSFSHGEFYMVGGILVYYITAVWLPGITPSLLAIAMSCAIVFALGATFERLFLTPMYTGRIDRPVEYGILITFGLAFTLQYFVQAIAGSNPVKARRFWDATRKRTSRTTANRRRCNDDRSRRRRCCPGDEGSLRRLLPRPQHSPEPQHQGAEEAGDGGPGRQRGREIDSAQGGVRVPDSELRRHSAGRREPARHSHPPAHPQGARLHPAAAGGLQRHVGRGEPRARRLDLATRPQAGARQDRGQLRALPGIEGEAKADHRTSCPAGSSAWSRSDAR